jgi:hypothetical protein
MARTAANRKVICGVGGGLVALLVVSVALISRDARAGKRAGGALSVADDGMYGSMGTARASLDAIQLVRCEVMGTDNGSATGSLTARCTISIPDPNDPTIAKTRACFSGNPAIVGAIQSAGDSRMSATFDPVTGNCLAVTAFNSSEYGPKLP